MIYTFTLNGEPLLVTIGASTQEKLEEALDESVLHIPITVRNYEYKMYGLLNIKIDDEVNTPIEFNYLIISDSVETISFEGYYSHSLLAVEYTNKLDKYLLNALTFTKPFIQTKRAPFEYMRSSDDGYLYVTAKMSEIFINQFYYTNKEIVLEDIPPANYYNQTSEALPFFELKDVYIRFDGTDTLQNISNEVNVTYTYTTAGDKIIEVGVYNDDNSAFITIYKHYIKVVDEFSYTLYDFLSILRDVVPLESSYFHEDTRLFEIDSTLESYFETIVMPQMFLQKMTVRQALNIMFKYINAISRLRYASENDILTVDFFNQINGSFGLEKITGFSSKQDAQQYATKAVSWLENALKSNFRDNPSVQSPSKDRYKVVRARNVQMTENAGGFIIPLEHQIYELHKISVIIPELYFNEGTETAIQNDVEIDITARVIEKRVWDLKEITENYPTYTPIGQNKKNIGFRLNRGGNIYWEKENDYIDPSFEIGEFQRNILLLEMIKEAVNEFYTLERIWDYNNPSSYNQPFSVTLRLDNTSTDDLFRNLKFNIEYSTLTNPTLQVDRADISKHNYYSELRLNQQERYTDFSRMSRDSYGKLQRSAVPNIQFEMIHTTTDDLLDVGMIDENGYIITNRTLILYNDFIKAMYEATLNHNRFNEFVGIDQEYRVFSNPRFSNVYDRHDFYGDYIIVYPPDFSVNLTVANSPTYVQSTILPFMVYRLRNLITSGYNKKITYAFIRTDGFLNEYPDAVGESYAIMTPVIANGGKGSFSFTFGFKDNLVAGNAIYKKTNFYNEPIRYTDEFGFFYELWFGMGSSYTDTDTFTDIAETGEDYFNEEHKYPLVKDADSDYLGQTFYIHAGSADTSEPTYNPLIVRKDASTNYSLSYQISVIPFQYDEYVLGQNFFEDNPIVSNGKEDVKLYLYKYADGTTYGIFDDLVVKSGYTSSTLLSSLNTDFTDGVFTFTNEAIILDVQTSWAIGDEDGNLYIACNKNHNGFRFALRHYRDGLLNIGNKPQGSSSYDVITKTVDLTAVVLFDNEYTRSQEAQSEALLNTLSSLALEYTRTLTESQEAQDLNTIFDIEVNYTRTLDIISEAQDLEGDYREWVASAGGSAGNYDIQLTGTFETQQDMIDACYTQLDINSLNLYVIVRGESTIPGNYFFAEIYSQPFVVFDIEHTITVEENSTSSMRVFTESLNNSYDITITGTYNTVLEAIEASYQQLDIDTLSLTTIVRANASVVGNYYYLEITDTLETYFEISYNITKDVNSPALDLNATTTLEVENTRSAQEWEYIGTSSATYNSTYVGGNSGTYSCDTASEMLTEISSVVPATNYQLDHILRVTHQRLCNDLFETCPPNGIVNCDTYYYRAIRST